MLKVIIIFFLQFQALNGFLMILTCDGEVFFATHSIESYLGFHQVSFGLEFSKLKKKNSGKKSIYKQINFKMNIQFKLKLIHYTWKLKQIKHLISNR